MTRETISFPVPVLRFRSATGRIEMSDADRELFRSHFLNADQLADQGPNTERADAPNEGRRVEQIEKEVDGGWLNVRVGDGDWASVPELAPVKTDRSQQGRIADA